MGAEVTSRKNAATKVHLVLVDDWELRGDGSGDMRVIQFEAMRRLRDTYERHGLRGSFNAEVMQQLKHVESGAGRPEHALLAQEWEEVVKETFARGHDVQLHLHPQWLNATFEDGAWQLDDTWSILDYPPDVIRALVTRARDYLENLLRPVDPAYRCVSFRSGSWCVAPSPHILPILAEEGIVFDMSIAEGIYYDTQHVHVDYREVDEGFLPYYPQPDDARRVAPEPQPIVCLPTHTFRPGLPAYLAGAIARKLKKVPVLAGPAGRWTAPSDTVLEPGGGSDYAQSHWTTDTSEPSASKLGKIASAARRTADQLKISDLSALTLLQMRVMLRDIRNRAALSGLPVVPVILENHSKDIGDILPIDRFAGEVAAATDIEVVTLTEVARNIGDGLYAIRTAVAS
jgi:hypothetical protein